MVKGGYAGKILRVNLTKGKFSKEDLPSDDILRKYVGNWGLGLKILIDELPLGVAPLEPENPLILMNAPLVGTTAPSPNNCTIATLNPDTGYTAGRSHSHGWFGPYLKGAGFDGLILTGASPEPVYLWIHEGGYEIRDAKKFWGKDIDTHESEVAIKKDLGLKNLKLGGDASVAAIGPAGENQCAGALIANDENHSFSHSGVGAVMGSKKVKAIAVYGKKPFPLANEEKLREAAKEWTVKTTKEGMWSVIGRAGVPMSDYRCVVDRVGVSSKNWLSNVVPGYGEGMSKHKVTPKPCFRCPVACSYDVEITSGPKKGYKATPSGGGENTEGSAAIMGVGETSWVWYLTDLNDRLGFESSTVGCAMAAAFEAYERGLLTKKDTDGLELKWGNAEAAEKLLRKVAKREGFGNVLADGPKVAAERIGVPEAAVHIKGSGMNLHDWRRAWGNFFGQIVSGGSGWPAPGADCWTAEPDVGYPIGKDLEAYANASTNPYTWRGKADEVYKTGMLKFWDDCIGVCWFSSWGIPGILRLTTGCINAATGWDMTPAEALQIGERCVNLERVFNISRGLTPEDDIDISPRLSEESRDGPAKGKSIKAYVEGWVRDFYRLSGWDPHTGKPWKSTLKRLGLEQYEKLVWG